MNKTREEWLEQAVVLMRNGMFKDNGTTFPEVVKVATGFPGSGMKRTTIGVHYPPGMTTNNINQVFISPVLEDSISVLETLVHELVHAATPGVKRAHGKEFGKIARALGLEGKLTATHAGIELRAKLIAMVDTLGPYPHGAIVLRNKTKGVSSLVKLQCPECEICCRMTNKEYSNYGGPICPSHDCEMVAA